MCGITAIVNRGGVSSLWLQKASTIVAHRGPDDEGYLLHSINNGSIIYSGRDTAVETKKTFQYPSLPMDQSDWKVGLAHRRLSILDLSPGGHQPMVSSKGDLAITFNGEIFNYIEIREELIKLGHFFNTTSDTEVVLHAWTEWGKAALHRFNGMFAFALFDGKQQKLYLVRDRFGVKPLYYTATTDYLAFASEVKQLRILPCYQFKLKEEIAYDYLRYSLIDHAEDTFDHGIYQLMPGGLIEVDVPTGNWKKEKWYQLVPIIWKGSEIEAGERFKELLRDSVKLRMRSDVPIGMALSGGLDSSTIVCLMRDLLGGEGKQDHLIKTITSCSTEKKFDEWEYAEEIINKVAAEPYKVFPSFEKFLVDLDRLTWHLDYPFGSTSQFSQWCVFEEAKKQGLTVMIDGQGADEQLAGYGGNDMSFYTGLLGSGRWMELLKEAIAYKKYKGDWPVGFVIGAFQHFVPAKLLNLLPDRWKVRKQFPPTWLSHQHDRSERINWPSSLHQSLFQQVTHLPLPSLLRYEDRNSMAFSIESRVPFMDYRLIEFTLGLPENFVYKRGERKRILRNAFKGVVPAKILERKDKMGFVSAEERWIKREGEEWFRKEFQEATQLLPQFLNQKDSLQMLTSIQEGKTSFNFDPWRVVCLKRFIESQ